LRLWNRTAWPYERFKIMMCTPYGGWKEPQHCDLGMALSPAGSVAIVQQPALRPFGAKVYFGRPWR
jgi:hypothetical protein